MTTNSSADRPASVRYLSAGDTAVVVEFGNRIDIEISSRVLALRDAVSQANIPGVIEAVPTFRSLLIHYDPRHATGERILALLKGLLESGANAPPRYRSWRVPVCYAKEFAPDLDEVAALTGLSAEQVVEEHTKVNYHVFTIGFVPGFPYLGKLSEKIDLPRRPEPRTQVPPRSVAVAAGMSSVYPIDCPGGWHLIGSTPIRLFDPQRDTPALFSAGDRVRFEAIDSQQYAALLSMIDEFDASRILEAAA